MADQLLNQIFGTKYTFFHQQKEGWFGLGVQKIGLLAGCGDDVCLDDNPFAPDYVSNGDSAPVSLPRRLDTA